LPASTAFNSSASSASYQHLHQRSGGTPQPFGARGRLHHRRTLYIFLPLGNSAFTLLPAVRTAFQFSIYASYSPPRLPRTEMRATEQANLRTLRPRSQLAFIWVALLAADEPLDGMLIAALSPGRAHHRHRVPARWPERLEGFDARA
jgi:hypothetical protein